MIDVKDFNMDMEVECSYDTGLSQIYYEDNFKSLAKDLIFFIDCGNIKFEGVDFSRLTKKDLVGLIDDPEFGINKTKNVLIEEFETYFFELSMLVDFSEDILHKLGYVVMSSRGYNQGDYINILVDSKQVEKVWGNAFIVEDNQKWFNHLLWDAPISLGLTLEFAQEIDEVFNKSYTYTSYNEDLHLEEFLKDSYDIETLNIDGIIEKVEKKLILSEEQKQQIKKNLSLTYEDIKWR